MKEMKALGPTEILLGPEFGKNQKRTVVGHLFSCSTASGPEWERDAQEAKKRGVLSLRHFPLFWAFAVFQTKADSLSKANISNSHLFLFCCVSYEFAGALGLFHQSSADLYWQPIMCLFFSLMDRRIPEQQLFQSGAAQPVPAT